MSTQTPTPKFAMRESGYSSERCYLECPPGTPIADTPFDRKIAERILTAVNSHAALVEMLEELLFCCSNDSYPAAHKPIEVVREKARATLALAKGK